MYMYINLLKVLKLKFNIIEIKILYIYYFLFCVIKIL